MRPRWSEQVRDLARDAYWYANGRQDAGGIHVDAWAFAHHFGDLAEQHENGNVFYRPSIQDAYKAFAEQVT